jgi:Flp pilus assembly protein CpaB
VDETTAQHYMRHTMRLLLVLSAFLTALVGLGAVPASARPASEICVTATVKADRQAPQAVAIAAFEMRALDRVNFGPLPTAAAPVRSVPLYAERLRV